MTTLREAAEKLLKHLDQVPLDHPGAVNGERVDALRDALAEEAATIHTDHTKGHISVPGGERVVRYDPPGVSQPAAPQAAEPAGWILEFKGHDREGVPFYLDKERAEIVAQGFRREVNGISYEVAVIPLYDRAPPAGGEEVLWLLEESLRQLEDVGVGGKGGQHVSPRRELSQHSFITKAKAAIDARRAKGNP